MVNSSQYEWMLLVIRPEIWLSNIGTFQRVRVKAQFGFLLYSVLIQDNVNDSATELLTDVIKYSNTAKSKEVTRCLF